MPTDAVIDPMPELTLNTHDLPQDVAVELIKLADKHKVFEQKHNHLAKVVIMLQADVDGVTGKTPEDKAITHHFMEGFRDMASFMQSKRAVALYVTAVSWFVTATCRAFGVDLTVVGKLINPFIHSLLGG